MDLYILEKLITCQGKTIYGIAKLFAFNIWLLIEKYSQLKKIFLQFFSSCIKIIFYLK